ncbi:MAG: acyl-CoA--6-aminopenicillanic acid acyl-transferase [Flavobacterium sp.]|nr:MAG: acyl-CoA--6-aminopenicillanic acid acyl-transferase [Flavobacterium sp.]
MQFKNNYYFLVVVLFSVVLSSCGTKKSIKDRPDISQYTIDDSPRVTINDTLFFKGKNSLRKNIFGQWELVASGNPLELGNSIGVLSKELIIKQEELFFDKVTTLVPSRFKQYLLRKFLIWYGREMYQHVTEEYKTEIYGISKYGASKYDFLGDNYLKALFLHSAHDIGHAFQDLALVGCSSFAVWGENTPDGNLIVARNFDFYAGDDFSKEKLISFIQPEKGYKFMAVSWAGMIGVMSGMNEKGLTVTINAGKSNIPLVAKTPISLVTREIIQYASTIEEAIAIAKKREVFVSESIMVGSAIDNRAVLIEISPENFGVFEVENSSKLICSNHFQSDVYKKDENNLKAIKESHSQYRFDRMEELLAEADKVTPEKAVSILRNKEGLRNLEIGYGNEKALNQLLAHHGIVFQPSERRVWVSSNPYQLGAFVSFQLDSVFAKSAQKTSTLSLQNLLIEKDPFIDSNEFKDYEKYRIESRKIETLIEEKGDISFKELQEFIALNPNFWKVYYLVGNYYYEKGFYKAALLQFVSAQSKEITTIPDQQKIENYIIIIKKKLNDF